MNTDKMILACLRAMVKCFGLSVKVKASDIKTVKNYCELEQRILNAAPAPTSFYQLYDEKLVNALKHIERAVMRSIAKKAKTKQLHKDALKLAHTMHKAKCLWCNTFANCLSFAYARLKHETFEECINQVMRYQKMHLS